MKRIFLLFVIGILCIQYSFPGTKADVISKSGHWLTINKGSKDGVKIGMTGIVKTTIVENGKPYDINVGLFTIKKVMAKKSEAYITKMAPGMNPQQAKFVVFNEDPQPKESNDVVIPPDKPIDWYLDKGDGYFDRGKYQDAKKYYQKMLEIDPGDPIANEKISECDKMINSSEEERKFYSYVKRADKYLSQGKIDYALKYYLAAYKSLPSKPKTVAKKFKKVSQTHPEEWKKFQSKHFSEMRSVLGVPADMHLEVYQIKSKAKRVYKNEKGYWEADLGDGLLMVYIPAGEFTMGLTYDEKQWVIRNAGKKYANKYLSNENPAHRVYLDSYWIGKYEVTLSQYKRFLLATGHRPLPDWISEYSLQDNHPAITISWNDATDYCNWLSKMTGFNFKLPTEAQWEKAARGTDKRFYPWGNSKPDCIKANHSGCSNGPKPIGSHPFGISPYGIHDMAGNVWEWCSDWYSPSYYLISPDKNPQGPQSGSRRVERGFGWGGGTFSLRSSVRGRGFRPSFRAADSGFRLCMDY